MCIFFAVSGLDVLDSLDSLTDQRKEEIINWIYDLQVVNDEGILYIQSVLKVIQ